MAYPWSVILKKACMRWLDHDVPQMSAALSYYTCFSLSPLLLLLTAILGLVFGRQAAEGRVFSEITGLVGAQSAQTIQSMVAAAWQPSKGVLALAVSAITLMFGAFGVLSELKDGLNRILHAREPGDWTAMIKVRFKFLGFILGIGFLLLVSLALSVAVAFIGHMFAGFLPFPQIVLQILDAALSLGVIMVLFAVIYRYLPNKEVPWRVIGVGSIVSALLFTIGKFALGLYLGRESVTSSYGAAGSILVILLWVYYSALISYFGAEFMAVFWEYDRQPSIPR